jgi:cyanoexosortase A
MKISLRAMAWPSLLARWHSLDNRDLWGLVAAIISLYFLLLRLLTQRPDELLNLVLVVGGTLLVLPGHPAGWQPRPGRIGRWVGVALLVVVLWRGQRIGGFEFTSSLLPLLAGMGLVLLAAPINKLRPYLPSLSMLALLPVMRAVGSLTPLGTLSVVTAWLTTLMLTLSGYAAEQIGNIVRMKGGGVIVSGSCAGLNILLQLLIVAVIFALAFPMRHRWQNGLMFLVAPLLGMVVNGMRITLLAMFVTSSLANKQWWFEFFHDHWGALLFSGLGMQLFVWLYLYWMARQVAALGSR